MKIRVLGAFGAEGLDQRPAAFLINDRILLDGGTVGGTLTPPEQLAIENAIISHCHLDHIAGLAFLTETLAIYDTPSAPLTICGVEAVVDTIRNAIFNNVVWPDFSRIPHADRPVVKYRALVEDAEQRVGDLWVTPIMVNHTVPTSGFIIHDGSTGFIYSGDTGPTEAIWKAARGLRSIRAVMLECAYPNRLTELAEIAKHLTPAMIERELPKLPPDVPVWIYHVKPQFTEEISEELARVGGGRVGLVEQDKTYTL
jgi:cAMP phosphodiesterase